MPTIKEQLKQDLPIGLYGLMESQQAAAASAGGAVSATPTTSTAGEGTPFASRATTPTSPRTSGGMDADVRASLRRLATSSPVIRNCKKRATDKEDATAEHDRL
ncbi:hypothetical protein OEZ85_013530 [Tetradesmus obliquus]|uniref:Uncharacterized protein n=1 Tax=Tetradesmus obliquus TaxID=3088 RepID=A0ABY8URL4_TETOB|nr:hypothetical protein OEZ85_013530 [Tetradesmus obliquus]